MDVNDGRNGYRVDWQGEWPEYEYYDVEEGIGHAENPIRIPE